MKRAWVVSNGFEELELRPWYAVDSHHHAAAFDAERLRRWLSSESVGLFALAGICRELGLSAGGGLFATESLIDAVGQALENGTIVALRTGRRVVSGGGGSGPAQVPVQPGAGGSTEQELHWVAIQLVDDEGLARAGALYEVTLPDGKTVTGTLDSMGCARVDEVPPGTCKVNFPDYDAAYWS
jgi:hypothetical protein